MSLRTDALASKPVLAFEGRTVQAKILVDGPDAGELTAALRTALGASGGAGWVISVVRLAPPWWCLNVLAAPAGRLQDWSYVGTRADLPGALRAAAA